MAFLVTDAASYARESSVLCIGNFDGLHRGHQSVLKLALDESKRRGASSIVLTFEPHPTKVLRPGTAPKLLMTRDEKRFLISKLGIDFLVELKFGALTAAITAKDFVQNVLLEQLKAKAVIVGENFTFGFRAEGNLETLRSYFQNNVIISHPQKSGEREISSTWIRELISLGDVTKANELLGYPFFITGVVVKGFERGRKLGFPTANLETDKECIPTSGVYATVIEDLVSQKCYASATNIGFNPTFDGKKQTIESYLLHFDDNLYGREMRLFFIERLRDELKFESVEELVAQIHLDTQKVKSVFQGLKLLPVDDPVKIQTLATSSSELLSFQPFVLLNK